MEEENERILEFARLQQQREEDRMEKKKQQEESMAAVQHKVRHCSLNILMGGGGVPCTRACANYTDMDCDLQGRNAHKKPSKVPPHCVAKCMRLFCHRNCPT